MNAQSDTSVNDRTADTKPCQHVGQEFSRQADLSPNVWARTKFCGRCGATSQRKPVKARRSGRCLHCDAPTSRRRRFCSDECHYWHLVDRHEGHLDKSDDGCWRWTGLHTRGGYGIVGRTTRGSTLLAHRAAWERAHGRRIPSGMVAMHRCDNPSCANPAHIRVGTYKENMQDAKAKGRLARGPRQCKVDVATARHIRQRYARGSVTQRMLAEEYGLHPKTVHRIVTGQTYRPRWTNGTAPLATITVSM